MKIRVPATSANLGPGFDVLGLALKLHENYHFKMADRRELLITGPGSEELSTKRDNLVFKTADLLGRTLGTRLHFSCQVERSIPLGMGLGSSSAAIVATLVGLSELFGSSLTKNELFRLAVRIEGHPDNVAPALFGGLSISYTDGKDPRTFQLEPSKELRVLVAVPCYSLATRKARSVLKNEVARKDAVYNLSRTAMLTHLLTRRNVADHRSEFRAAIDDKLHQLVRAKIVPGYAEAKQVLEDAGVLGAALSGAGPSLIGFTTRSEIDKVSKVVNTLMKKNKLGYKILGLEIDLKGCSVEEVRVGAAGRSTKRRRG